MIRPIVGTTDSDRQEGDPMNREETIKFLALIKVAYPNAFRDMDQDSKLATINMWQTTFPDTPFIIMEMALDRFRRVSKFPPMVAEMYEELNHLYHEAVFDASIARTEGDAVRLKKSMFVAGLTSRYRGGQIDHKINYDCISDALMEAAEYKMLEGG